MKRFVSGIVLVVIGLIGLMGSIDVPNSSSAVKGAFMLLIPGGVLTYYGNRYLTQVKQTTAFALQMIRENGKIDAFEIAQKMGLSEVDIRVFLAESQRKGVIPFKVDIV